MSAVQALYYVHLQYGSLAKVLLVLGPWADVDEHCMDGPFIRGVGAFLNEYPSASPEHLSNRLLSVASSTVEAQIKPLARDLPRQIASCMILRKVYNRGLKPRQQLPPVKWGNE